MAYTAVIDDGLDKYRSDSEINAEWLRLDGTNGPQHSIQWDLTPTASPTEGLMYWNVDDGTLNLGMPGGNVNLQLGQEMLVRARNETGVQINNGQVVIISGASGGKPLLTLADADLSTAHRTLGVATEDIAHNSNGYVNTQGTVRDFDTSSFSAGDTVYLSQTAGGLTATAPSSPAHKIKIGTILVSSVGNGELLVSLENGLDLAEVDDVLITALADNDVLTYDSGSGLWVNTSTLKDGNIPDFFLRNDGDDTTSGTITATGYKVDATIDHSLTNSSDDLMLTNPNQDGNITFNINRDGTSEDFLKIKADPLFNNSASLLLASDNVNRDLDTGGVMNIQGDFTIASVGVAMSFQPTIQGGNLVGLYMNPINDTSTTNLIAFWLKPVITGVNQSIEGLRLEPANHTPNFNDTVLGMSDNAAVRQYTAFGVNDASTVTYTGFKWGQAVSFVDIGFTLPTYTDTMISLIGGASRPAGTNGSITQTGIKLAGFGTQTNLTGSDTVRSALIDGGLWSNKYDYSATSKVLFGAGEDAGIGYDGTDLVIDAALVGAGGIKVNDAYTLPKADGSAGDIIKTDGSGAATFVTPSVDIPINLTTYDAEPARGSVTDLHGGLLSLATAQPLNSVPTNIVVTKGSGKVMIVVNAGSDFDGSITVTGTSVDRETGATSPADTDTITVDAISTDGSDTDTNGNPRYSFTGAYITSKWFTGTVTLSTANLTLTDVDVYHVSFEQFNDSPNITLHTFDANLFTTNVNAEFDAYLYCLEVTGDKVDISRTASLNLGADGETAIANKYWRLRRGNLAKVLDGTTDGVWAELHYSNSPAYCEDVTVKIWAEKSQSLTLT
jgi:hypothetical protein